MIFLTMYEGVSTLFSFGLIADIQYADIDSVIIEKRKALRNRYYRNASGGNP